MKQGAKRELPKKNKTGGDTEYDRIKKLKKKWQKKKQSLKIGVERSLLCF